MEFTVEMKVRLINDDAAENMLDFPDTIQRSVRNTPFIIDRITVTKEGS